MKAVEHLEPEHRRGAGHRDSGAQIMVLEKKAGCKQKDTASGGKKSVEKGGRSVITLVFSVASPPLNVAKGLEGPMP